MPSADVPCPSSRPPGWAPLWQLPSGPLTFGARPRLMGILNVTPDSFSDGGRFFEPGHAIEMGQRLIDEGADLLDIGGESTRPYATPVSADDELARVLPVIRGLVAQRSSTGRAVPLSIDTSKPRVAREALAAGAEVINDVTALQDPQMVAVAREFRVAVCAMHMQGTPQTMQDQPHYQDVAAEVLEFLRRQRDRLVAAGIAAERIALDPGIGFGKTHAHNLTLLRACHTLHALGCPVLVGHSRKGFIQKVLADPAADRTAGNIGVALALARQHVQVLRVHDVQAVRQALLLFEAVGGT